jgi:hypothetical protein
MEALTENWGDDASDHAGYQRFGYTDTANRVTAGAWETEAESCAALDAILDRISGFRVFTEVRGAYTQPRVVQDQRTPRIDRVLTPLPWLMDAGWVHGPIGIECKRSGEKLGPPISQCLDYSRALWEINHNWVALNWVFLWPAKKTSGTVASILAQQRIGTADTSPYHSLKLASGEAVLALFGADGRLEHVKDGNWGRKTGSR